MTSSTSTKASPPASGKPHYIVHDDSHESLLKFVAFAKSQHWHKRVLLPDQSHGMNDESALRTDLFIQLCALARCQYGLGE